MLKEFGIERSLSIKGCPYDNAVAEATYKSIKVAFVYSEKFEGIEELNRRLHSTLGYLSALARSSIN